MRPEYCGRYFGISPSNVGFGEIEVVIDDTGIAEKIAGGDQVYYNDTKIDELRPMLLQEKPAEMFGAKFDAYRHKDIAGFYNLVFNKQPRLREPDLIITGMRDVYGIRTLLYRVERKLTLFIVRSVLFYLEFQTRGAGVARFRHNGRPRRQPSDDDN